MLPKMSSNSDKTYPLMLNYIPEEFVKVAQEELNETAEKTVRYIRDLTNRAKADATLRDVDFEPDFLHQFLRVSKYNVDKAFKRLYKYATMRKKISSIFTGVGDRISINPSYRWVSPLPYRSFDGCAVYIHKVGIWNTSDISFEHLNRLIQVVVHQSLRIPATQIKGFRVIMDFEDTSMRHLKYATPSNLMQVVQMYLECTPARYKSFHLVNCNAPMRIGYNLMYPILTEKIKKRVIIHKHVKELFEYFPKYTLPVEYGGDLKDYYMYSWMKEANEQMGKSTLSGERNIF